MIWQQLWSLVVDVVGPLVVAALLLGWALSRGW